MSRRWSGTNFTAISSLNEASTGVHSLCAWVYAYAATASDGIFVNNAGFTDFIWLGVDNSAGNQIVFQQGKSAATTEIRASLTLSTWTHIAGVYDGTNINLYVNGVLTGTPVAFNPAGRSNFTGGDLGTGSIEVQDSMFLNGVALSAAQIVEIMQLRNPRLVTSSVTCWFPLFSDAPTLDMSGNGHTLTSDTSVAGSVAAPAVWGAKPLFQPLRVASGATSITATGTTNVTGAAAVTSAAGLVATGTTQVTGAATITKSAGLVATGTTNVTGAAALTSAASLTATGTTQVTGTSTFENEYRQGSTTDLSASHSLAAWIFPTASQTSHVFRTRMSSPANDRDSGGIEINGTTINFFANNSANSAAYSYSQAISLNTWTYVSIVYDSTAKTYTSYVNAIAVNSASFDGTGREAAFNQWAVYGNFVGSMRGALIADNYAMSAPQLARTMLTRVSSAEYTGIVSGEFGIFLPFWSSVNSRFLFASRTAGGLAFVAVIGTLADDFSTGNPPGSWQGQEIIRPLVSAAAPISITATGLTQTTGAAATTEAAALVATGTTQTTGSAALTAAAALVATGTTQTTGAASTTEAAALVATGTTQTTGAAALTSAAGLVAAGLTQVTGAASVTTPGDVAATGLTQVTGTAALTAAAPLVAAGTTQTTGAAALASSAPLVAAGNTQTTGAAVVTSAAAIVAAGLTQTTGVAVITSSVVIVATGTTITTGAAAFQGVSPPSSGGDNDSAARRWLGALGTRRRLRR